MKYKIIHTTRYEYPNSVSGYHSVACLHPKSTEAQVCTDFSLRITPSPAEVIQRTDFFGNTIHYFSVQTPHRELLVEAQSTVTNVTPEPELNLGHRYTCQEAYTLLHADADKKNEVLQYMLPSPFVHWSDTIRAFAQGCFADDKPLVDAVKDLCQKIYQEFQFKPDFTTVHTPLETVLEARKGVCQDFSHLAIASIRSMGFAARYVSGYLETLPPPGKEKLQGSDASHAWISAYVPELGWCDFDPTNNVVPGQRHITTAWGRDYSDVPPLKGILLSSGQQKLHVEVDVVPMG